MKLHLITTLPAAESAATRMILSSFHHGNDTDSVDGIDFSHCLYRTGHDAAASSYIVRSGATGSRTIVNFNELPEMTVGEFERVVDALIAEVGVESGDGEGGGGGGGDGCWWHFEVSTLPSPHNA